MEYGRSEKSVWMRRKQMSVVEMRENGWGMRTGGRRRRRRTHEKNVVVGLRAMSSSGKHEDDGEASTSSFVLPIFPLSLVALPDGMVC